jgi:hypothetical protein
MEYGIIMSKKPHSTKKTHKKPQESAKIQQITDKFAIIETSPQKVKKGSPKAL